jgi:hypothetical protein
MDILYYSNNCGHCQNLLAHLAKNGLIDKYNFINIDRRTIDPYTNQIHVMLDRGTKVSLPPNVTRVPTLVLVNNKQQTVVGEDIYAYLEPAVARGHKIAVGENGEPSGFVLATSSGGVNIVSETFTMYDASPEELLAKGIGTMRQMHNYAPANKEIGYIQTPTEESSVSGRRENRPNDVTMTDNGNPGALTARMPSANSFGSSSGAAKYDTYSLPSESAFYRAGQIVVPELQRPPAHRHEKLGENITIESLQQKRNEELQYSMPPMAQQLNQAVIPEVANVYPPSSAVNRRRDDFGAPTNMAPSFQPLVGGGGYFSTQPTSVNSEQTVQRNSTLQRNSTMQQNIFNEGYQSSMPKLSSEDAREMLFGKRPDDKGKPVALSTPYLVNI